MVNLKDSLGTQSAQDKDDLSGLRALQESRKLNQLLTYIAQAISEDLQVDQQQLKSPEVSEDEVREILQELIVQTSLQRRPHKHRIYRQKRRRFWNTSGRGVIKIYATEKPLPGGTSQGTSRLPVHAPHIVPDPVSTVTTALAVELRRSTDVDLSKVDVSRLVQSMLRVVPRNAESSELADRVGPFYDTAGLTSWLVVSRQALEKRIAAGKLLACVTSDRVRLYPTWQFTDSGKLLPGLAEVLTALRQGTADGWTLAAWLTTPVEELDDSTAVEWLKNRRDPAPVIELARHDSAAWAA